MNKTKKIILVFVALFSLLSTIIPVNAASLSLSSSASTTSTIVGNTFTVTFKFSSGNPL